MTAKRTLKADTLGDDETYTCIIEGKICQRWCGGVHCLPSNYGGGVRCPKCYWYGDERELLDGETCPNCKLVFPE